MSCNQHEGSSSLFRPFLAALPISGVAVTVIASGVHVTVASSDDVSARIDELQFELGEGPQWEAARTGRLVALPDIAAADNDRWPVFAAALEQLRVGAIFCVPVNMGAVTVGVATLFAETPQELNSDQISTALAIASAIAGTVVFEAVSAAEDDLEADSATTPALRREVHQATGVILVQLNISATDAYSRLQAYAFANGRTVQAVAHDVVAGLLSFEDTSQ